MFANDEEPVRILVYSETMILNDSFHTFGDGVAEFRFDVQRVVGACRVGGVA